MSEDKEKNTGLADEVVDLLTPPEKKEGDIDSTDGGTSDAGSTNDDSGDGGDNDDGKKDGDEEE